MVSISRSADANRFQAQVRPFETTAVANTMKLKRNIDYKAPTAWKRNNEQSLINLNLY